MNQPQPLREYERLTLVVEIWKKTVEVQQHFNDIEMRIRNIAVTVLGASLGAAAFSMKEALVVSLFGKEIFAGQLIIGVALVAWAAFYFMDRFWYHRLLKGAVKSGRNIEKLNKSILPEIDLTSAIKETSPIRPFGFEIHSDGKMKIFYGPIAGLLIVMMFALGGPLSENDTTGQVPSAIEFIDPSQSQPGITSDDSTKVEPGLPAQSEELSSSKVEADETIDQGEGN